MNEVRALNVASLADEMLDIIDLGDAGVETKQVMAAPIVPDNATVFGYPG